MQHRSILWSLMLAVLFGTACDSSHPGGEKAINVNSNGGPQPEIDRLLRSTRIAHAELLLERLIADEIVQYALTERPDAEMIVVPVMDAESAGALLRGAANSRIRRSDATDQEARTFAVSVSPIYHLREDGTVQIVPDKLEVRQLSVEPHWSWDATWESDRWQLQRALVGW